MKEIDKKYLLHDCVGMNQARVERIFQITRNYDTLTLVESSLGFCTVKGTVPDEDFENVNNRLDKI